MAEGRKISLIKVYGASAENDTLSDALRDRLHWEIVDEATYHALKQFLSLPKTAAGIRLIEDCRHLQSRDFRQVLSIDDALALMENEEKQSVGEGKARKSRKGLTVRQMRELEKLRSELGEGK